MSGNLRIYRVTPEMHHSTTNKVITDEADVGEIEILARSGNETKIENYGNKFTQRRHYFEADADEVRDVTNKETTTDSEGKVKIVEVEITEKEAALIEKGKVEDCEGVLSQRRHFSDADEERDVTNKETTADSKGKVKIHEVEITEKEAALIEKGKVEDCEGVLSQRRHFPDADEERDATNKETSADSKGKVKIHEVEITEKEAALIEKGKVEDCEGVLSQRRHFPGTTTIYTGFIFSNHLLVQNP
ncbi:unnamed protein product [Larinioides sclopetarius]|uniref:Uncharacterized protein n=1 Tax=Larinioides sclopetarius TaxID=280406 RepID=A0AAV2BHF3_9ARAC